MNTDKTNKEKTPIEIIGIIVGIILGIITLYFLFWPKDSKQEILIGYENSTDIEIVKAEVKKYNGEVMFIATFKNITDKHGLDFDAALYNGKEKVRKTSIFKNMIRNKFAIQSNQEISIPISYYEPIKTLISKEYGAFKLVTVDFSPNLPEQKKSNPKIGEIITTDYTSYTFMLKCTFTDIFNQEKFVQMPVYFHIRLNN